jgi:hypothetical protein
MKIFIVHTQKDRELVEKLKNKLSFDNIEVINKIDDTKNITSENFISLLGKIIETVDLIILIFPKDDYAIPNTNNQMELILSALTLAEYNSNRTIVIPVKRDKVGYFAKNGQLLVFGDDFEQNYQFLLQRINNISINRKDKIQSKKINEKHITKLQEAYSNGNLVLFCGAGISYDAGVPSWGILLKDLLEDVFKNEKSSVINANFADVLQKKINISPLIMAQYIKRLLSENFTIKVRDALYKKCTNQGKMIDAIAELSRQKRNKKPLKAIITFNFDDLIETKLKEEKIEFKTDFKEGQRIKETEIPIFHPHGFLPRDVSLSNEYDIVFSEDAYHTQFIEPFSWGNLIQLNHLNNSACLFIGISLTDPNMRRLLDVSMRKSGNSERNHFIIKRHYRKEELYSNEELENNENDNVIQMLEIVEEIDAEALGFNVIWVDEFSEIPKILNKIHSV